MKIGNRIVDLLHMLRSKGGLRKVRFFSAGDGRDGGGADEGELQVQSARPHLREGEGNHHDVLRKDSV